MQKLRSKQNPPQEKHNNQAVFALLLVAVIVVISVIFNFISGGKFLDGTNVGVLCIAGSSNVYFDLDASSNQSSG